MHVRGVWCWPNRFWNIGMFLQHRAYQSGRSGTNWYDSTTFPTASCPVAYRHSGSGLNTQKHTRQFNAHLRGCAATEHSDFYSACPGRHRYYLAAKKLSILFISRARAHACACKTYSGQVEKLVQTLTERRKYVSNDAISEIMYARFVANAMTPLGVYFLCGCFVSSVFKIFFKFVKPEHNFHMSRTKIPLTHTHTHTHNDRAHFRINN